MEIKTISDFRKAVRQGPYAWPGGYPLYFIMDDGEAIAFMTVKTPENRRRMLESIAGRCNDGWRPVAIDVNWEDAELFCAHTNERIESAYAEDEACKT
jgi:hypothetical protein